MPGGPLDHVEHEVVLRGEDLQGLHEGEVALVDVEALLELFPAAVRSAVHFKVVSGWGRRSAVG